MELQTINENVDPVLELLLPELIPAHAEQFRRGIRTLETVTIPGPIFKCVVEKALAKNAVSSNGLNPENEKLISDFSEALRKKLLYTQQRYGKDNDWQTDEWEEECKDQLLDHVYKGDPIDVAIYAAFCWSRGWKTS